MHSSLFLFIHWNSNVNMFSVFNFMIPIPIKKDEDIENGNIENYFNDTNDHQASEDNNSSDQSSVEDVENIEVVDNGMLITMRMLVNTNNQCACACHKSDKREMDNDEHCKTSLKPILQILENVIENDSILQEEIDLQQID